MEILYNGDMKILSFVRKYLFWVILGIGIIFRLTIAMTALNGDLLTQAEWGKWMYSHGTKGLYEWNKWLNEWPNHPPLISALYLVVYQLHSMLMGILSWLGNFIALHRLVPTKFLWFFDFIKWFGDAKYDNLYLQGIVLTTKLVMIMADGLIAGIIYWLCKVAKVDWKKYIIAFLFLPFSWYLSALWGQSDQLAFVWLILSFILLTSKFSVLSPLLFAIAVNLKPTGLILAPLFIWGWIRQKQPVMKLVLGGIMAFAFSWWSVSWFTSKPIVAFVMGDLYHRLFEVKPHFTTVSAFNVWYVFHTKDLVGEMTRYLSIPALYWGYFGFLLVSVFSFILVKTKKLETIFSALFVSGFGGWLVMTNMYERYVFTGVVSLLLLSIYQRRYFRYFVLLSVIYLFNMYNGWWHPVEWVWLKEFFLWNNRIVTRILALVNVAVYLRILWRMKGDYLSKTKSIYSSQKL